MIQKNDGECGTINIEAQVVLDCLDWDILILGRDFKVIFANTHLIEDVKMGRCDVVDNFCYKITHHIDEPCQPPNDPCPLREMIATGKPVVMTHTHFDGDNNKFLANTIVAPLEGFDQELFLHVSIPIKNVEAKQAETEGALAKTLHILDVIKVYQQQMQELKVIRGELEVKLREVEDFNKLAVGREMKMIELKEKIKELERSLAK